MKTSKRSLNKNKKQWRLLDHCRSAYRLKSLVGFIMHHAMSMHVASCMMMDCAYDHDGSMSDVMMPPSHVLAGHFRRASE
jgi:hypothetical protein